MAYTVVELTCPGCGEPITPDMKRCPNGHPVNVSTFTTVDDLGLPAVGGAPVPPAPAASSVTEAVRCLKLRRYDKAQEAFDRALEETVNDPELYFYAAVCLLEGKKPFLHQRPVINRVLEYVNAAILLEPRGVFYYLLAYVKYDYFSRKFLNVSPDYRETLAMARQRGYSDLDADRLFALLGVDRPGEF